MLQVKKVDTENEGERIIHLSGKLTAVGIHALDNNSNLYPSANYVTDSLTTSTKWVPLLVQTLLLQQVSSKLKVNILGQCTVQAVRPMTAIVPILLKSHDWAYS